MAQRTVSVGTQQVAIYNALVPPEGPKTVPITLDFSEASSFLIDFTQAYMATVISSVQSVWCDNSANPDPVTFTVSNTGQAIVVPALSQGVFPVISPIRPKIIATTASMAVVKVQFLNVPLPVGTWQVGAEAVTATAAQTFTVATAATAVAVFAGHSIANGAIITNPANATESLFVDLVHTPATTAPGAGGTTTELKAGQSFTVPGGLANAVLVNAATAGHTFTAWRW